MERIQSIFSRLSKGNRIISPAASVAIICFFLPWVLVSCDNRPVGTFSGWQLATGSAPDVSSITMPSVPVESSPSLFLILLAAIGCLVVVFLVYQGQMARRMGAYLAIGLSILSLLVMLFKFIQGQASAGDAPVPVALTPRLGAIGTVLAYIAIIIGASLDLNEKRRLNP
jgi:hypothetical protein